MKKYIILVWCALGGYCKSPGPITAHPDDRTFTSGTQGSARMTNEMPHPPQNVVVKPDTSKIRMDSVRRYN